MKASDLVIFLLFFLSFTISVQSQPSPDATAMQALKDSLRNPTILGWSDPDPCQWSHVKCSQNKRVTHIQISNQNLSGSLPLDLRNLSSLTVLEVADNQLSGPIPSLSGLSSLQELAFDKNNFSYMPPDFFKGLESLQSISLDYNPLSSWEIPASLKDAMGLRSFSANQAGLSGTIPDFLGGDTFPGLIHLHLAINNLEGQIPWSFSKSSIQTLWLNGQASNTKLNGSLSVLQNMTSLTQLWLHRNLFTGPLANFSRLSSLEDLELRDNTLTGIVPRSLINLPKLNTVSLTNNLLQGPTPKFNISKIKVDMRTGSNSFCSDDPGVPCDGQVNILLSVAESMGYPMVFSESWKGNNAFLRR
ncbi:Receptor protein kinase [Melia azedarach]|uniref:Receptor protein kinase n=1 Tax=Melia azedarach TaxID=155640 RepID=A0ACC1XFX0_MELAZ|nr:Receptor protein kinase [Melia azedarach]